MFQQHVKKTYLIAWDQQIQPLEPYGFIASCKSPSGQTKYLQCGQHLTGLEKNLNSSWSFGQAVLTFCLPRATPCLSELMIFTENDLPGFLSTGQVHCR